jgi:hypothetical protein
MQHTIAHNVDPFNRDAVSNDGYLHTTTLRSVTEVGYIMLNFLFPAE